VHLETGLVGFHGPVAASDFTGYTREQLRAVLFDGAAPYAIPLSADNLQREEKEFRTAVITPGRARGALAGGNLSLLAALAGTPHALDCTGKLVFLEDVGEKPYRIDRMLTQLRQAANLDRAAAIALGVFSGCEADEGDRSLTLLETLTDRLGDLGIPVVYGLSFGHIADQCTLPVGVEAELDTEAMTVRLLEQPVGG
jgi:muramoyltetrapeptide carboxypeptidase